MPLACVLISDISGSTALYEAKNNEIAMRHITLVVARMREIIEDTGGFCVKSQGDDTISFFDLPDRAFQAAWAMIREDWPGELSIHAGIYYGEILSRENEIYGNAVNTAARLASAAKPGEILIGHTCYDGLSAALKNKFVLIGELPFKGKQEPVRVYSCFREMLAKQTQVFSKSATVRSSRIESADFTYMGQTWTLLGGQSLTIGRAADCDIVVDCAWVSRKHAALTIRQAQLEYSDHSSSGSVLRTDDGRELFVHRRTNLLTGSGQIILGSAPDSSDLSAIGFKTHELKLPASEKTIST